MKAPKLFVALALVCSFVTCSTNVPAFSWSHHDHDSWQHSLRRHSHRSDSYRRLRRYKRSRERIREHIKDHWDDHHHHHH